MPETAPLKKQRPDFLSVIKKCACPGRLWMGASGVVAGTACAIYTGNFSLWSAMLSLIAILASQLAFNMLRSYWKMKRTLEQRDSDVYRFQKLPMSLVLTEGAKGFFLIAAVAFGGLTMMVGLWALIPAALVALIGYMYLCTTSPIFHSWWEQFCQFIFFGPVAVFSTFFYQALHNWGSFGMAMADGGPAALSSLLIGMLTMNASLVGNCIADTSMPELYRDSFSANYEPKRVSLVIISTGLLFYAVQWYQHFCYPIEHGAFVMFALSISFVLNMVVAIGIRKGSLRKLERMYKLAVMNPFIYSMLALIVLANLREPSNGGYVIFD